MDDSLDLFDFDISTSLDNPAESAIELLRSEEVIEISKLISNMCSR